MGRGAGIGRFIGLRVQPEVRRGFLFCPCLCRFRPCLRAILERRLQGECTRLRDPQRAKSVNILAQIIAADYFAPRREARLFVGDLLDCLFVLAGARQQRAEICTHDRLHAAPFALKLLCLIGTNRVPRRTPKSGRIGPAIRRPEIAGLGRAGDEDGSFQHIERNGAGFDTNFVAGYAIGPPGEFCLDRCARDHFDLALLPGMRNFFSGDRKPRDLKPVAGPALEGDDPGKSIARQFMPKNCLLRGRLQSRRFRLPRPGAGRTFRCFTRRGR